MNELLAPIYFVFATNSDAEPGLCKFYRFWLYRASRNWRFLHILQSCRNRLMTLVWPYKMNEIEDRYASKSSTQQGKFGILRCVEEFYGILKEVDSDLCTYLVRESLMRLLNAVGFRWCWSEFLCVSLDCCVFVPWVFFPWCSTFVGFFILWFFKIWVPVLFLLCNDCVSCLAMTLWCM